MGITDGDIFEWPMAGDGPEVPDVPDTITGWKVLTIGSDELLRSSIATGPRGFGDDGTVWPTDEPLRAVCNFGGRAPCECGPVEIAADGTPFAFPQLRSCSGVGYGCGIYAFNDLRTTLRQAAQPCPCCSVNLAVVRMEMGGRFIQHAFGLRAEYAMVTGIVDSGCAEALMWRGANGHPGWQLNGDTMLDARVARRYGAELLDTDLGLVPNFASVSQKLREAADLMGRGFALPQGTVEAIQDALRPVERPGIDGTRQAMRYSLRQRRRGGR